MACDAVPAIEVNIDPVKFDSYVGEYQLAPDFILYSTKATTTAVNTVAHFRVA